MAYVGDAANVSFSVAPAALRMPAAVRYAVVSQTGTAASAFIAPAALSGMLTWREEEGTALNLTLPARAPLDAFSRCMYHQAYNVLLPCTERTQRGARHLHDQGAQCACAHHAPRRRMAARRDCSSFSRVPCSNLSLH